MRWPHFEQHAPAAACSLAIFCVWFFRATRGKTAHCNRESTALPKAKTGGVPAAKIDRVTRVCKGYHYDVRCLQYHFAIAEYAAYRAVGLQRRGSVWPALLPAVG